MKLWLVKINDDDFDYDCFVSAVVWARTASEAKQVIRDAVKRGGARGGVVLPDRRSGTGERLIARKIKQPAKPQIVHQHWHAG